MTGARARRLASQRIRRQAAKRGVEQLNSVHDGRFLLLARERRLQLENAARISGGHNIRAKCSDVLCLAVSERHRGIRLNEIIDSRGTTANGGLGNFREFKLWNSG